MVLRGRAATPVRPGLFIRSYLLRVAEDHPSEIHRALRDEYAKDWNKLRPRHLQVRPPTFPSFLRYFHQLISFGLVVFTGREEPMSPDAPPGLLQIRNHEAAEVVEGVVRFFALTAKGRAEPPELAFYNPVGIWRAQGWSYERPEGMPPPARPPAPPTPPPTAPPTAPPERRRTPTRPSLGTARGLAEKWRNAARRNVAQAIKDLGALPAEYSTDACKESLIEYREMRQADYDSEQEFKDAREVPWEEFLECLENLATAEGEA